MFLQYGGTQPVSLLIASNKNRNEEVFCSRQDDAFRYKWDNSILAWANPPFTQLDLVLAKIIIDSSWIVLLHPEWGTNYVWRDLLEAIRSDSILLPNTNLYIPEYGESTLPRPDWRSSLSLIDLRSITPESHSLLLSKVPEDLQRKVGKMQRYEKPNFVEPWTISKKVHNTLSAKLNSIKDFLYNLGTISF